MENMSKVERKSFRYRRMFIVWDGSIGIRQDNILTGLAVVSGIVRSKKKKS